jgi:formate hydrogenlyase subunit 6/NADH:ubiquinone oxidoreductase subunit I
MRESGEARVARGNMVELPDLNETRCTGCGDCTVVCPTGCLEMAGPLPWLPRPRDCVSCTVCVLVCPVTALTMTHPEPA